jgi:hypothetical protein
MIRDHIGQRFVLGEEESFLLGDPDFFAGTGSVRQNWDGLSKLGEYDDTLDDDLDPAANNGCKYVDAEGNPFNTEHVNEALENLELYSQNPEHLLGIITRHHARTLRGDGVILKTLTNLGPSPVLRTGRIGDIMGVRFVHTSLLHPAYPVRTTDGNNWAFVGFGSETPSEISDPSNDVLADVGVGNRIYNYYGSAAAAKAARTPYSEALIIHKDCAVIGDRQQLEIESSAHLLLLARSVAIAAHERVAFAGQYRKGICKVIALS